MSSLKNTGGGVANDENQYERLVAGLLRLMFVLLLAATPVIVMRGNQLGWNLLGSLQLLIAVLLLILLLPAIPLAKGWKLSATLLGVISIGLLGVANVGPVSTGMVTVVAVLGIAASLQGLRTASTLLAISTCVLIGIAGLFLSGVLTPSISFEEYHMVLKNWVLLLSVMMLTSLLLIGVNSRLFDYWRSTNKSLENRNRQFRHSMELNQVIVSNMVSGYFRASLRDGKFTYLSLSAIDLLHRSNGKSSSESLFDLTEDQEGVRSVLARVPEQPTQVHYYKAERRCSDETKQWLLIRVMAWHNELDELDGVQGIIEDISELKHSEQRFREMFESAPEAITMLDAKSGLYLDVNPQAERLHGISREDLVGKLGPWDLSPKKQPDGQTSKDAALKYLSLALEGEIPRFEWEHTRHDGVVVPCEVSLARLSHPTQDLIRASVVDISDRKLALAEKENLQEQLSHSLRTEAIGRLTGGVAHDFNNLLAVILGNLELLKNKLDEAESLEFLDASIQATKRGADLTNSMLSFARKARLQPAIFCLNEIVEQTEAWAARVLPATIDFKTHLQSDLCMTMVDRSSLQSALLNLILNARDAMPEGGILTIRTEDVVIKNESDVNWRFSINPGPYVLLSVSDTGLGIAPESIDRVFEPFYTSKDIGEGSGLGLSMVLGFVDQSGGSIKIESEEGVGTKVSMLFPSLNSTGGKGPKSSPGLKSIAEPNSETILVVEDEPEVLKVISRLLQSVGYQVHEASSGKEALQIWDASENIDLLITDIIMPGGMLGPEVAYRLREHKSKLPVIFLSGYADSNIFDQSQIRSTDQRIMKPVSRDQLIDAVAKSLGHTMSELTSN